MARDTKVASGGQQCPKGAGGRRGVECAVCALLLLATLAVYLQVRSHDFITHDDRLYVTRNPHVLSGLTLANVGWAFTSGHASNWHPLTWLSHMADCEAFGPNPGPHHLVSLMLHAVNGLLLFLLLHRATGALWPSAFVSFTFALHPLNVESVAWIAERKNVLSTLFWLLATGAYARYVVSRSYRWYGIALLLYAAGLMAKPMLVTLPFTLWLLDVWPLRRIRFGSGNALRVPARAVLDKVPFLVLAAASSVTTYVVQRATGAVTPLDTVSLASRFANALVSYGAYAWHAVFPVRLAHFYPYPEAVPAWPLVLSALFVAGATVGAVRAFRRCPAVLVGWLWYLGTLVPVVGLVQVGRQARADRYAYVPLIGLFVVIAWGFEALVSSGFLRKVTGAVLAPAVITALGVVAWHQAGYWKDSPALYQRALAITGNNAEVHNSYGVWLASEGQDVSAVAHFEEALRLRPRFAIAQYNLANALGRLGRLDDAIVHYTAAIEADPGDSDAHNNLGIALRRLGRLDEAAAHYREAIRIAPGNAQAHNNLAELLARQGKTADAELHYREALRIDPGYEKAREGLARLALAPRVGRERE